MKKKFKVIICCQGQPFEYKYDNLFSALYGYAYHYLKKNKHGTMNFSLEQDFEQTGAKKNDIPGSIRNENKTL